MDWLTAKCVPRYWHLRKGTNLFKHLVGTEQWHTLTFDFFPLLWLFFFFFHMNTLHLCSVNTWYSLFRIPWTPEQRARGSTISTFLFALGGKGCSPKHQLCTPVSLVTAACHILLFSISEWGLELPVTSSVLPSLLKPGALQSWAIEAAHRRMHRRMSPAGVARRLHCLYSFSAFSHIPSRNASPAGWHLASKSTKARGILWLRHSETWTWKGCFQGDPLKSYFPFLLLYIVLQYLKLSSSLTKWKTLKKIRGGLKNLSSLVQVLVQMTIIRYCHHLKSLHVILTGYFLSV